MNSRQFADKLWELRGVCLEIAKEIEAWRKKDGLDSCSQPKDEKE